MRKRRLTALLLSAAMLVSACATTVEEDNSSESNGIVTEEIVSEEVAVVESSELSEWTTISETSEEIPITEDGLPSPYTMILDEIYYFATNYEEYPDSALYDEAVTRTGIEEVVMAYSYRDPLESLSYTLVDVDDNGISELLILDNNVDPYWILAMYTIIDDEAILVAAGWARNSLYLLSDKTLFNHGSGGAAYSIWNYYEYSVDAFNCIETYYTSDYINGEQDYSNIYVYRSNGGTVDTSNPSSSDEIIGTTQDAYIPGNNEYYEFDNVTLLADYS